MPRSNVTRSGGSRDSGYHSMLTRSGASLLRNWPMASSVLSSARSARRIADSVAGTPMGRSTRDRFAFVSRRQGLRAKANVSPTPVARAIGWRKTVGWKAKEGKFRGKFKKTKYKKYKEFKKYSREGVIVKQERGSVYEVNAKESIYVGHAIAYEAFLGAVCMAIVKYLAKKCINYSIVNWNDTIRQSTMYQNPIAQHLLIFYKVQKTVAEATLNNYELAVSIDTTWRDFAIGLKGNFRTNLVQNPLDPTPGEYKFVSIGLTWFQNGAGTFNWQGTVAAEQIFFDIKFFSSIVIQNRTKDADGGTSTDVINSNPIVGKRYQNKSKWLNGFEAIRTQFNGAIVPPMIAYGDSGVIVNASNVYQPQLTKKPPPAYMMGASKETNVLLNPGDIKKGNIKFSVPKIGFNSLMQKLFRGLQDPNYVQTQPRLEFGYAELFGFETQLNDRTNADAKIAVSWELNQQYEMRVFGKRPSSFPYVDII